MELNLFSLKVFLEVVNKRSFSRAAKALFLTQPAVSLHIKNLENYFCTPLLIRGNPGMTAPTDAGKVLWQNAKTFLELQRKLLNEMEEYRGDSLMQFSIGACCTAGEQILPSPLKTFSDNHPEIHLSLNIVGCDQVFHGVLSGIFKIGIAGVAPKSRLLISQELVRVPLSVFEAGGRGAHPRTASIRELIQTPLILREESAGPRKEFQTFLAKHGMKLKQFQLITVSQSNMAIKELVMKGIGFSVLPQFLVEQELRNGDVREIRLEEGGLAQPFFLMYRKEDVISRPLHAFLDFMLNQREGDH